LNKIQV